MMVDALSNNGIMVYTYRFNGHLNGENIGGSLFLGKPNVGACHGLSWMDNNWTCGLVSGQ